MCIWRTSTVVCSWLAWASGLLLVVSICPAVSLPKTLYRIRTCWCDVTHTPYIVQLAISSQSEMWSQFVLHSLFAFTAGLRSLNRKYVDTTCVRLVPFDSWRTSSTVYPYPLQGEIRCRMLFWVFLLNFLAQERTTSAERKSCIIGRKHDNYK
jgi:hypothetical protein